MIDLDGIYMIWIRDLVRWLRDRTQILGSISRPVLWLVIMGSGLGTSFKGLGGVNYSQFIFPGIIAMNLIFASLQSAISIIWDREFGFLKEVLVAPISRTSIAIGKALSGSTLSLLQGSIVLLFAPLIGASLNLEKILKVIPLMFLVSFACTSIGIIIASRMTSFEGFGTISNFVIMPMFFLSGSMFPIVNLPVWLKYLIWINPLTYGVDALREVILDAGAFPLVIDLFFMIAFASFMQFLAVLAFNKKS